MSSLQINEKTIAVAVGSPETSICSIGSFARIEAEHLRLQGFKVDVIAPDEKNWIYPPQPQRQDYDSILIHIPSLHDRKYPQNVLSSLLKFRWFYPISSLILVVHELSEAPLHWRLRAKLASVLASKIIVNTEADFKIAKKWHKPITVLKLGPTLWNEVLMQAPLPELLNAEQKKAKKFLEVTLKKSFFDDELPVVLHPGMITAGKGADFLLNWLEWRVKEKKSPIQFVLMGGIGPKNRDQKFFEEKKKKFQSLLGEHFLLIQNTTDLIYKNFLTAADLVVLPYENGVSERRSTFLSACSNGSDIWTTTSPLSTPLDLANSGIFHVPADADMNVFFFSLEETLQELQKNSVTRRILNLKWSKDRFWTKRIQELMKEFSHKTP